MGSGGSKGEKVAMAGIPSSSETSPPDRTLTSSPLNQEETVTAPDQTSTAPAQTSTGEEEISSSDPATRHDPNLQHCWVCDVTVPNTYSAAYQHWMGKRHRRRLRELQEDDAESDGDDVTVTKATFSSVSDTVLVTGRHRRRRKRQRKQGTEKTTDVSPAQDGTQSSKSKRKRRHGRKRGKRGKQKRKSSECSNSPCPEPKRTRLQTDDADSDNDQNGADSHKTAVPGSCKSSFPSLTDLSQLAGSSHVTAPPLPPDDVTHVIFVDFDNWSHFFQKLPHELPRGSFVYGFAGGNTTWREPRNCSALTALQENGCFYMHPSCGRWKDAADFAICVHAGKLDERLPKGVPFTVLSGDKGFYELAHQLRMSSRRAHIVNPHAHDMNMVLGLLNSIGQT